MSFATRCRAVQPFDDGPAPQRERGVAADLGFITYHRELPVNDFRYLGTEETLRLDWEDPWFSKFDNRNLWRQYDAPVSAFLYVEHYEVRKEIVLRPKDLEKWVDLGLDGKEVITVEEQPEIKRKVVEFLESKNPVTIDGVPAEGILDRVHFIYRNLRTIGGIVCDSGPAVVFVARRLRAETAGCRRAHNDGIDRGTYRGLTILPRDRKAHGWGAMWSNLVCTMKKREIEFPDYHTGGQLFAIGSDRRVSPRTRRKGNYTALALKTFIRRLVISLVWPLSAATAQQPASFHPATPQRLTFTTDTSVTTPGTVELELGGFFAENVGALPTSVKFTPDVSGFFHRTEIAVSFDTLSSVSTRGDRDTRFGDTLTVAMRRALYESDGFSFALAPVATFFLRGEDGARLGGTAIAVYGRGANSIVVNLGLTGATSSSLSNPSVQLDLATDFFRSLSDRFTIFSGALYEKASESAGTFSLDQGLAFRVRPDVVLDIGIVERSLADGPSALELLLGLTVNLGWPEAGRRACQSSRLPFGSSCPWPPSARQEQNTESDFNEDDRIDGELTLVPPQPLDDLGIRVRLGGLAQYVRVHQIRRSR